VDEIGVIHQPPQHTKLQRRNEVKKNKEKKKRKEEEERRTKRDGAMI
jgi:hypothetical protein